MCSSSPIVSIHYPKAGGSSLVRQFSGIFGEGLATYIDPDIFGNRGQDRAPFPERKTIVHGHFKATRYETADATMFTILRHPVDVMVSWYFYWRAHPQIGGFRHERFMSEKPGIVDFARTGRYGVMMSDVYFGGFDTARLNFVGFHETREADIPALGRTLGIDLTSDIHENITPPDPERDDIENDPATIGALTDVLAKDIAFYENLRTAWS